MDKTLMELALAKRVAAVKALEAADAEVYAIKLKTAKAFRAAGCKWMHSESDPQRNRAWEESGTE